MSNEIHGRVRVGGASPKNDQTGTQSLSISVQDPDTGDAGLVAGTGSFTVKVDEELSVGDVLDVRLTKVEVAEDSQGETAGDAPAAESGDATSEATDGETPTGDGEGSDAQPE